MAAPSKVAAALQSPDRTVRTQVMADIMRRHEASDGACTFVHLAAAGFSEAEIEAYRDDARGLASGRVEPVLTVPAGRIEGVALVREARAIRARQAEARA